ncbi:MAG: thioesterase [Lachnospiraceae bacterium]|nr:thioesterase [Lachnospiraceae bacterium]
MVGYVFVYKHGAFQRDRLDEQGNSIVRANSPWVFLNTDMGRPERPDELERAAYQIAETPHHFRSEAGRTGDIKNALYCAGAEEWIPMEYAPRKIKLPEGMQECEAIPVIQEFIDSNHHVNNARYVEIAVNLVKEWETKTPIKELRVEYKRQAQLGDVLYPKIGVENDWNYVALEDRDGSLFASVALRK